MTAKRRRDSRRRRHVSTGAAPGTIVVDPDAPKPVIRLMAYGKDDYLEKQLTNLSEIRAILDQWPVTWVNIDGLGDADVITQVGALFKLHPLALEDVVNVHQRAKTESYENSLYIVARMVEVGEPLYTEQISLFLGSNFVVTFQERPGDCFDPVRERIRKGKGRVRDAGADYLAYSILDAAIDHYFPVLEECGERLETLENELVSNPETRAVSRIHAAKRDLLGLRRAAWPLRDALSSLYRDVHPLISDETRLYLRDCYDHTIRIFDLVESQREIAAGLMEVYLSSISNRLNEVMKVLTVIGTIFIPLTFIASIYGMNFHHMPELEWRWGYVTSLGIMAAIAIVLLIFFWRRGWLGSPERIGKTGPTRDENESQGNPTKSGRGEQP